MITHASVRPTVGHVVELVGITIRYVLQGTKWNDAFLADGLAEDVTKISKSILAQMEWSHVPPIAPTPPTPAAMAGLWPTTRRVPLREICTGLGIALPVPLVPLPGTDQPDSILVPGFADEEDIHGGGCPHLEACAGLLPEEVESDVPCLSDDDIPLVLA